MPRIERWPHYVKYTKKDHICGHCGGIIPKGTTIVHYRNLFTGKKEYYHDQCPEEILEANRERMKRINEEKRNKIREIRMGGLAKSRTKS